MKGIRAIAAAVLLSIFLCSLFAELVAPEAYETQFREAPNATPDSRFLLGTDELGRDRLSRLVYGTRISLLLAPAAALLSTAVAALTGGLAGYLGGWLEKLILAAADLFLSLPWLFLLLTARAMLPLNVSPLVSVAVTFILLGLLGWAGPARIVCAGARSLRESDFLLAARAFGCSKAALFIMHVVPNLRPILYAQFWVSIPLFILSEANLGLLGLGIAEPMPSWGNLLRELENYPAVLDNPWMLAPAGLLVLVVSCFQLVFPLEESVS